MKLKFSILTIYVLAFLLGCGAFTIYNYNQLSEGEGWGIVGMVGLFCFGLFLFVIDLIIRNRVKNKVTVNIIGLIISIIATLMVVYGGFFS